MPCTLHALVFASWGLRGVLANVWSRWPLVSIQWTNYYASNEKVCFYFWGQNASGMGLPKEAVGPVSFKESRISETNMSSFWKSSDWRIPIYYGYAMTTTLHCPQHPTLAIIQGVNSTYRLAQIDHNPTWMGADWLPNFAFYPTGVIGEVDNEYMQGLALKVDVGAALHCKPKNERIFKVFPSTGWSHASSYATNFVEFIVSGLPPAHCQLQSFQCKGSPFGGPGGVCTIQDLDVEFDCLVLDDPQPAGHKWLGNGTRRFNISVNFTKQVQSTCDFQGKAAKLTATIIGNGSAEFPYEYLIRKTPASLFGCNSTCPTMTTTTASTSTDFEGGLSSANARFVMARVFLVVVLLLAMH